MDSALTDPQSNALQRRQYDSAASFMRRAMDKLMEQRLLCIC